MSDNLFERLTDLSIGTGSQTPLAAIDRIKELEAKLAKVIPLLGRIKSHKVFYMEELADLIAELKGDKK